MGIHLGFSDCANSRKRCAVGDDDTEAAGMLMVGAGVDANSGVDAIGGAKLELICAAGKQGVTCVDAEIYGMGVIGWFGDRPSDTAYPLLLSGGSVTCSGIVCGSAFHNGVNGRKLMDWLNALISSSTFVESMWARPVYMNSMIGYRTLYRTSLR